MLGLLLNPYIEASSVSQGTLAAGVDVSVHTLSRQVAAGQSLLGVQDSDLEGFQPAVNCAPRGH